MDPTYVFSVDLSVRFALNTIIDPNGTQQQIVRANMPFGAPSRAEFGTFYIAYAATASVTEQMHDEAALRRK